MLFVEKGIECYNCNNLSYDPDKWNNNPNKENINCYSYSINYIDNTLKKKPRPGYYTGQPNLLKGDYDCSKFDKMLKKEVVGIYKSSLNEKCKCDYHKIALVFDNEGDKQDFHFYRQDNNDMWSHKPGSNNVRNTDDSGDLIYDPESADRDYRDYTNDEDSGYNYDVFCGYYCVPNKFNAGKN